MKEKSGRNLGTAYLYLLWFWLSACFGRADGAAEGLFDSVEEGGRAQGPAGAFVASPPFGVLGVEPLGQERPPIRDPRQQGVDTHDIVIMTGHMRGATGPRPAPGNAAELRPHERNSGTGTTCFAERTRPRVRSCWPRSAWRWSTVCVVQSGRSATWPTASTPAA